MCFISRKAVITFLISRGNMVSQRQYGHFQISLFSTSKTYIHNLSFICLCFHESVPNYLNSDFQTSLMVPWKPHSSVAQHFRKTRYSSLFLCFKLLAHPCSSRVLVTCIICRVSRRNKCCLQCPERDPASFMLSLLSKVQGATTWLL